MTGQPCTRALVVDDDARVRAALCALLDDAAGFRCRAVDSQQATRLVMGGSSDVDSDVAVVDMSAAGEPEGQATLVALLAGFVPVVVVSMSRAVRAVAMAAGAAAFVEKDGDATALVAAVRAVAHVPGDGTVPR